MPRAKKATVAEAPENRAPAAQDEPLTHDEKVTRFDRKIGELRQVRYDPIGKAPKSRDADAKAKWINAEIAKRLGGQG